MLYYDLYEQDSKLQCNLKKVSKLTFKVAHPGNNKQDASLALEIFDQATSVSIKSHYPDGEDAENIPIVNIKHNFYKNSFFPSSIIEWNNLDPKLRNSENFSIFKNNILKFIRPKPNSFFNCCSLKEIRLITRLRLELSHLREHKFK